MTDHDNPASIEANIERDRAAFASTLGELEERVSVEKLAEDALGMIRDNAAAYTNTIDRAVRSNPMAVAMIGAGIAWLVMGKKKSSSASSRPEAISRWESEGGSVSYPAHTSQAKDEADWFQKIEELRHAASDKLRQIAESSRSALDQTRDYAAEKAAVVSGLAQDMTSGFRHGLDDMTEAAREKIIQTRQRAYQARQNASRSMSNGMTSPGTMIEEHPLIAGAVALAAGAALAASLPRTRTEDRWLGSESDRLMAEAADLLREEYDRAAQVAGEFKDELSESAKDAMDQISAVAEDAADRVKTKAMGGSSGSSSTKL
jgi:gas vesicle protein